MPSSVLAQTPGTRRECPSHRSVLEAVRVLLDRSQIEIEDIDSKFELRDAGSGFSVTVDGRSREFVDPNRDCTGRAQAAAVFVALTLAPPELGAPHPERDGTSHDHAAESRQALGKPSPEGTRAPHAAPAPDVLEHRWQWSAEVGATLATSPHASDWRHALGGELRLLVTERTWGFGAGVVWQRVDEFALHTSRVWERRIPVDLGVRWSRQHAWLRLSMDAAAVVAFIRLQQRNSPQDSPVRSLLDWGGRAALNLHIGHSALIPFVRTYAEIFPTPHPLSVEPSGRIGTTAWLWVGATVGVAGSFN